MTTDKKGMEPASYCFVVYFIEEILKGDEPEDLWIGDGPYFGKKDPSGGVEVSDGFQQAKWINNLGWLGWMLKFIG